MDLNNIPSYMKQRPQWVVWASKPKGNGKIDKIPRNPRHPSAGASVSREDTWGTLEEAREVLKHPDIQGIGFILTEYDKLCVIDLDDCLNEDREPNEWAAGVVDHFDTFTEISQSGRGLHLFLYGQMEGKGINKKEFEVYDRKRMICFTGRIFKGNSLVNLRQRQLTSFLAHNNPPTPELVIAPLNKDPEELTIEELVQAFCEDGYRKAIWCQENCVHKSQSEYDLAIYSMGRALGFSNSMCQMLIHTNRTKHNNNPEKAMRSDYIQLTASKAAAMAEGGSNKYTCEPEEDFEPLFVDAVELMNNPVNLTWLIPGYIPTDSLIWLAGAPSSLKSFVAVSISYHLAMGLPWAGKNVNQGKVAYICGEGFNGLSKRMAGIRKQLDVSLDTEEIIVSKQPFFITEQKELYSVIKHIKYLFKGEYPALIVIDTKAANMVGSDNDPAIINALINNLRLLQRTFSCSVLMVDHVGFGDVDRPRGPTHQIGAAEAVYVLTRDATARTVTMDVCKPPKDFEQPQPLVFDEYLVKDLGEQFSPSVDTLAVIPRVPVKINAGVLKPRQHRVLNVLSKLYADQRGVLNNAGDFGRRISFERKHWLKACAEAGISRTSAERDIDMCVDENYVRKVGIFYYVE